jgi:tetratricopeptide (TPR) repeat protein
LANPRTFPSASSQANPKSRRKMGFSAFVWMVLLLVGLGVVRSAIATRLDGFTLDEAYHIAAGASYLKYGDFRINPEHPPLVKLWVGSVIAATGFHLDPLRRFSDKPDERVFTQRIVFWKNDPDSVQRRARAAMFAFNGLLLISLVFALERVFDARVALGALLFLMIDPTVAAHWPVVMTDLPVALLSATSIVLATRAFRDWIWTDLAACSAFLGLDLAAKHSAPVVLLSVTLIGVWLAFWQPLTKTGDARWRRMLKVGAVLAGALAILWGFYFFRYAETPTGQESFNRPLADKIRDVNTPFYHSVLVGMNATRIVPRAYLWGFADTIRAGMEGRADPQLIFGRLYVRKGPRYFFSAMIAMKLPIGLSALSLLGLILFFARDLPSEWNFPAGVILAAVLLFLLVLSQAATYAGIRHALPVVVLLSIFAGLFVERALASSSRIPKTIVLGACVLACASAVPVLRPWEYFNEFAGGTKNAHKYFDDEGVDLGQRSKEIVAYYRRFLKPRGEMADIIYLTSEEELKGRGVEYLGRDKERDLPRLSQPERSGTIFIRSSFLSPTTFWDRRALREAIPVARFGNLFVYRGTFFLPGNAAATLYFHGIEKLYADKPDDAAAEKAFQQSAEMDPTAFFVHIELGNLLLKRGARDEALRAYSDALKYAVKYAPEDALICHPIELQIERFAHQPLGEIPPLRDPFLE